MRSRAVEIAAHLGIIDLWFQQIEGGYDETLFAAKPSQYILCVPLHKVTLTCLFDAHDKSTLRPFEGIYRFISAKILFTF